MRSPKAKRPKCSECKGEGVVRVMVKAKTLAFPAEYKREVCTACKGTGHRPHQATGFSKRQQEQMKVGFRRSGKSNIAKQMLEFQMEQGTPTDNTTEVSTTQL